MIKIEIKYPNGRILKKEVKTINEARKWLKKKTKETRRNGKKAK